MKALKILIKKSEIIMKAPIATKPHTITASNVGWNAKNASKNLIDIKNNGKPTQIDNASFKAIVESVNFE